MKKLSESITMFETPALTCAFMGSKGTGIAVVSGAVHAGPWHAPLVKEQIASVAASLLDEGTLSHTREEYRMVLERDGSRLSFWTDNRYLYFNITATISALENAVHLCFEALKEPALKDEEVRQVIMREAAERVRMSEETRGEAGRAFSRLVFERDSAGYEVSAEEERSHIQALTKDDVRSFIKETYRGRIVIAATGDIEPARFKKILETASNGWNQSPAASGRTAKYLGAPETPRTSFVSIPGKESVDVFMGASLPLSAHDPMYPAFRTALDLLGGGFSDHLTQTVRDRDGLTYGTYARIKNLRDGGMYWGAWAMFGNSLFEKGVTALKREIGVFLDSGITETRLKEKVGEIKGRMAVKFSDMHSTVNELLTGLLAFGSAHAADEYLERVEKLTADDVQIAARRHIRIDAIAAAGAIDEKGNLL